MFCMELTLLSFCQFKGGQQYQGEMHIYLYCFLCFGIFLLQQGLQTHQLNISQHFETQCEKCVHQWINFTIQEIQTQQNIGRQDA